MDKTVLDDIYAFWFGADASNGDLSTERIHFWMHQSDETDCTIRERFGALLPSAASREWDVAALTDRQAIGLVVLFDQFPRNIFRTSGEAYGYDHLARDVARQVIARGWERFTLMERFLLGLPFVHNEDIDDQDYALNIASEIILAIPPAARDPHRVHLDKTTGHRDVIRRFGRFPHRNEALGRATTPEEAAFLAEHGRGF